MSEFGEDDDLIVSSTPNPGGRKRKNMKNLRSKVWIDFDREGYEDGTMEAQCLLCKNYSLEYPLSIADHVGFRRPCSKEAAGSIEAKKKIREWFDMYIHSRKYVKLNVYSPQHFHNLHRSFSLWSMKKDPDLESALSRNKRWIVNNQIKNILLRSPNQEASIKFLQKKFKTLDLQGKALNWLKKYPCCFDIYLEGDTYHCRLTKRMLSLVEEEQYTQDTQEPEMAKRLAKLLLMSLNQRLNVMKINEFKRNFGFPDDYLLRLVPKYPEMFRLVNHCGRRSSMEIELISWDPDIAVSEIEIKSREKEIEPCFSCLLPSTWVKSWERFHEFNSTPYISPYSDPKGFIEGFKEIEKRTIGLVHEFLSLTLWKKASIIKLGHFRRELCLPENLNVLLLKHPGLFYVSNKYQNYTVLLREGYNGSELINKDPLVLVKEKFGELMQDGLHEYNRRHCLINMEKKKKNGNVLRRLERRKDSNDNAVDTDVQGGDVSGIFDPEERKRFYKVLFDDDNR